MRRALFCCAAIAMLAMAVRAGEPAPKPETLIRLEVEPAPAPRPALRYQLLPELAEMSPGNPVQGYLGCFMEHQAFLFDKESFDRREELLAMPLKELPAGELMEFGKSALSQADRAARLDNPDWQILLRMREEGFNTLLPDIQQLRSLARALLVRLRAENALGRFDDASRTFKTIFALARQLGEHPTLIGNLVGIAIANMAIAPLEEMLPQPGCPNLYWALTNLPHPLISMGRGMDGERMMVAAELRDLDDRHPMSADQLKQFIAKIDKLVGEEEPIKSAKGLRGWLDARIKVRATVDAARQRLVESGLPEDRVRAFPADHVILLDEKRKYVLRCDDATKLMTLPFWQAEALDPLTENDEKKDLLADTLLPSTKAVRRAQARLDQRIALLQHVEALRLYAAGHDGRWPGKLSEVAVPLPDDPVTGKPFLYEVTGATAHLRGTPPPGEKNAVFNVHYEITIRK